MDRRQFFVVTGRGLGGSLASLAFLTGRAVRASAQTAEPPSGRPLKIAYATDTTSICPYCGVGCGLIVSSKDGKIINIEGDPDHPINEGALCSKGQSVFQVANNERRLSRFCTGLQEHPSGKRKTGTGPWTRSPVISSRRAMKPSLRKKMAFL